MSCGSCCKVGLLPEPAVPTPASFIACKAEATVAVTDAGGTGGPAVMGAGG